MLPDRLFSTFQTASQGLAVQRENIAAAARNIANSSTSAPQGSKEIYRVQSVKTSPAGIDSFKRVLSESVGTLRKTDPRHFETSGAGRGVASGAGRSAAPHNLGPRFEIAESERFRFEYDPAHPDADDNGMVRYPDVDLVQEMTRLVSANRLYEANLSAIEAEKEIIKRSMEI